MDIDKEKMILGYKEMSKVNLAISEESFFAEEEAENNSIIFLKERYKKNGKK